MLEKVSVKASLVSSDNLLHLSSNLLLMWEKMAVVVQKTGIHPTETRERFQEIKNSQTIDIPSI